MPQRKAAYQSGFELPRIVQEFLTEYRDTPRTHAYYLDNLERRFLPFMAASGIHYVQDVTPALIRDFLDTERLGTFQLGRETRKRKPGTINHRYRSLKRFLNWCVAQQYLDENPAKRVKAPKIPKPLNGGFSREECSALVREAGRAWGWLGARDRAIIYTLLGTGCRAGGLLSMTTTSPDWTRRRLLLHEKGDKERYVPMGAKMQGALKEYLRVRPDCGTDALWVTFRNGPMSYASLNAMLRHVGQYAGIEGDMNPHRFRHTYASLWYEEHHDILALRNLLGHSKIETTERYLRTLGFSYGTGGEFATPDSFIS